MTEQQFGPTLPIHRYSTMDEAVAKANGLDAGLGASVCSAALAVPQAING